MPTVYLKRIVEDNLLIPDTLDFPRGITSVYSINKSGTLNIDYDKYVVITKKEFDKINTELSKVYNELHE